jgi:hypothetical protein
MFQLELGSGEREERGEEYLAVTVFTAGFQENQ